MDAPDALPVCTARALFVDDEGGVMIVDPTYGAKWEIPGGTVERGETPREACMRGLQEGLALDVPLGRLLVVDWAPLVAEERVLFVFDGGMLTDEQLDAIELQPGEMAQWAYLPPDELFVMTTPRHTRPVLAAVEALATGATCYLEHGVPVESGAEGLS